MVVKRPSIVLDAILEIENVVVDRSRSVGAIAQMGPGGFET